MIWHGDSRRQGAGCPQHPAGTLRGLCEGCASLPERGGRLQLVPGLPLNATPSRPRLSHALDRLRGRRPGQNRPSKNALGAGYTRKPVSAPASKQHGPGPGHAELVGTAKRSAMETIAQPPEREAGRPPAAQPGASPRAPPVPCHAVVLGLGPLGTQKRAFCWEPCKLAPPSRAKRPAQRAHVPPSPLLPSAPCAS